MLRYCTQQLLLPEEWQPALAPLPSSRSQRDAAGGAGAAAVAKALLRRVQALRTTVDADVPTVLQHWRSELASKFRTLVSPDRAMIAVVVDDGVGLVEVVRSRKWASSQPSSPLLVAASPAHAGRVGAPAALPVVEAANVVPQDPPAAARAVAFCRLPVQAAATRLVAWSPDARLLAVSTAARRDVAGAPPSVEPVAAAVVDGDGSVEDVIVVVDGLCGWKQVAYIRPAALGMAASSPARLAGLSFRRAKCGAGVCTELVTVWHDGCVRRVHVTVPVDTSRVAVELHSPRGVASTSAASLAAFCLLNLAPYLASVTAFQVDDSGDVAAVAGECAGEADTPRLLLWRLVDDFPFYVRCGGGDGNATAGDAGAVDAAQGRNALRAPDGFNVQPKTQASVLSMLNPLALPQLYR
jgi:hypothetical protein